MSGPYMRLFISSTRKKDGCLQWWTEIVEDVDAAEFDPRVYFVSALFATEKEAVSAAEEWSKSRGVSAGQLRRSAPPRPNGRK